MEIEEIIHEDIVIASTGYRSVAEVHWSDGLEMLVWKGYLYRSADSLVTKYNVVVGAARVSDRNTAIRRAVEAADFIRANAKDYVATQIAGGAKDAPATLVDVAREGVAHAESEFLKSMPAGI